jgi:hypothetical protein
MEEFNLDEWLVERYHPLTLERIKRAHFDYNNVVEILEAALKCGRVKRADVTHHCELYNFGRQQEPCINQCDSCRFWEQQ